MSKTIENPIVLSAPVIKQIAEAIVALDETGKLTKMQVLNAITAQIAGPKKHWSYLTQATDTVIARGMKRRSNSEILVAEVDLDNMMDGIEDHLKDFQLRLDEANPERLMRYHANQAFQNFLETCLIFDDTLEEVLDRNSKDEMNEAVILAADEEADEWFSEFGSALVEKFQEEGSDVVISHVVDGNGHNSWDKFEKYLNILADEREAKSASKSLH